MADIDTSRISPTAHYTGYVWRHRGMSPPELATRTGRYMHTVMRGPVRVAALATGGVSLDDMLVQRHIILDTLLEQAIRDGKVTQIVEVAGGLSPRGLRFAKRHPHVTYVEGDLPGMVARKRARIANLKNLNHHVVELNALADDGPSSIFEAAGALFDPSEGTAIITEGLVSYFPVDEALGMWARFARFLGGYREGVYLSDVHFDRDLVQSHVARGFRALIQVVARGTTHVHYASSDEHLQALRASGFASADVHAPSQQPASLGLPGGASGPDLVSVSEAWV